MGKRLYVGGLPYATTDQELRGLFAEHGAVESAAVVFDRMSRRSKGFGFVEMATDEDAKKAIENLNGQKYGGRSLFVNEAHPKPSRDSDFGRPRGHAPRHHDRGHRFSRREDD